MSQNLFTGIKNTFKNSKRVEIYGKRDGYEYHRAPVDDYLYGSILDVFEDFAWMRKFGVSFRANDPTPMDLSTGDDNVTWVIVDLDNKRLKKEVTGYHMNKILNTTKELKVTEEWDNDFDYLVPMASEGKYRIYPGEDTLILYNNYDIVTLDENRLMWFKKKNRKVKVYYEKPPLFGRLIG